MSPSKTVLITGAAGGLGRAMVEYLAARGDCVFAADAADRGCRAWGCRARSPRCGWM